MGQRWRVACRFRMIGGREIDRQMALLPTALMQLFRFVANCKNCKKTLTTLNLVLHRAFNPA
jgi:hypothetical protein